MKEIWILGATGRMGRAVAANLSQRGLSLVLVGRDASQLERLSKSLIGDHRIQVAEDIDEIKVALEDSPPIVVVNTIGSFSETAAEIASACPAGSGYVDLSNDLPSMIATLNLRDLAIAKGSTYVAGAGFGVLGSESVVLKLHDARGDVLKTVRVDAKADFEVEYGPVGTALAGTIIELFARGGFQYEDDKLAKCRLFSAAETVKLPDGGTFVSACVPLGELEAARRASGAPNVIAGSGMVPNSQAIRVILPMFLGVLGFGPVANIVKRNIANFETKQPKNPRPRTEKTSWAHARLEWSSGEVREGWLRTGDAMTFTANVLAETAARLARRDGQPGAFTPGALFGPELAEVCGGQFSLPAAMIS